MEEISTAPNITPNIFVGHSLTDLQMWGFRCGSIGCVACVAKQLLTVVVAVLWSLGFPDPSVGTDIAWVRASLRRQLIGGPPFVVACHFVP
jgi:hypothetical protein